MFNGLGDYADIQGVEYAYTVARQNIASQVTANIIEIPPFIAGETLAVEPTIEVYYKGELLEENVEYTLTFKNNTSPTAKASYVVTLIGNYTGTIKGTFLIAGIDLNEVSVRCEISTQSFQCDLQTIHK